MRDAPFTADRLLALFDLVAEAEDAIPRLRRFVLDLAVRGKLVEQDPSDEPATELLKRIAKEKVRLVKAGEIRKPRDLDDGDEVRPSFDLPKCWRWCRLDTVGAIIGGGTPSANDSSNFAEPGEGFPWLTPADLGGFKGLFISRGARDLTEKGLASSSATPMPAGSVLFTSRAPIGYVAIAANPISTNQGFKSIVPYVAECSAFIALAMRTFAPEIDAKAPGTTFKEVSGKIVAAVPFPLPPLAEQQRIVAKVDELMALCDRLEGARAGREAVRDRLTAASLTRLTAPETDAETFPTHARFALQTLPTLTTRPDQIKALRQTILNLAVRGKLVEQDPADEPASELLKRIAKEKARLFHAGAIRRPKSFAALQESERPFDEPLGWSWARLAEVALIIQGFAFSSGDYSKSPTDGYPLVKIGDIGSNAPDVFIRGAADETYLVQPGDLLLGLSGSIKCSIWQGPVALLNQRIARLRPASFELSNDWLFLIVNLNLEKWKAETSKLTVQNVKADQLNEAPIPLPPLAEQHRIVAKVDALMTLCDQLEASLATATTTRSRLLEALLNEALNSESLPVSEHTE